MSVVFGIIKEEYDRLISLLEDYIKEFNNYPKGCIAKKKIKNKYYYYLEYRKKNKIIFEYLGKEDSEKYLNVKNKLSERLKIQNEIKKIKDDLKDIKKYIK